jgi:hypothetical protein
MKTSAFVLPAVALSALLAGCVGTGPNTQQGAVTGGTLGAIAGAIIGHNSAGADALGGAILGGTAGAIAGGTLGNSVDQQRGTLYDPRPAYVYRERPRYWSPPPPPPPPPVPTETVPAPPAPGALWIPGYWTFDGRAYAWTSGRWEIPPPNVRAYVAAHWESRPEGYAFVPGYWR